MNVQGIIRKMLTRVLRRLGLFDQSPRTPALRRLAVSLRGERMRAAAEREGIDIDEFADAVTMMAQQFPVTFEEALSLVETRGLARAQDELERVMAE